MCDPVTLLIGAMSVAGGAMSMSAASQSAPAPPPAALPAVPTSPVSESEAPEIKLGSGDDDLDTTKANRISETFERRRVTANTFGNLGKSSLTI